MADKIKNQYNVERDFIENQTIIYGEHKISRLLTSPPFNPPVFIGREEELKTVHEKLFAGQNFLMLVNGQGGIGKTSFASKYWQKYQYEYSHLAFLFVENGIANALLSLSQELGLKFEKETTEQQLQILIKTVANLQKPCLLILDNANDRDDLEKNYEILRKCSNFHILLTSRIGEYPETETHKIGALQGNFPLEVFKKHYPKLQESENTLFWNVFKLVQGNTLVLEIIAKNLAEINQEDTFYSLNDLLKDLENLGLLHLSEQEEIKVHWQSFAKAEPSKIIEAMYDLRPLDESELALLSIFAVLPAENIAYDTLKSLLQPENERQFAKTLSQLFRKGWIEKSETEGKNSYKISPVVQEICRHKNQTRLFADCGKMIDFLINELHPDNARKENYKYAMLYSNYAESVISIFVELHINFFILLDRVGIFYQTTGNLSKALDYYEKMKDSFQKLYALEPNNVFFANGLAISYGKLGGVYTAKGDLNKAFDYYEKATELYQKLYALEPNNLSFANGLAISYEKLGNVYTAKGDLNKVLDYYEKNYELNLKLYALEPNNVSFANDSAVSYAKLGEFYTAKGDLNKALHYYEKCYELNLKLYALKPNNVSFANGLAISYGKLGEVYIAKGDLNKALEYYERTTELYQKLYALEPNNVDFANGLAISYEKLGEVYTAKGDLNKSLGYYEKDLEVTKKLYAIEPNNVDFSNGLAISYEKLGNVYTAKGDLNKALNYYEKYYELNQELYALEPNNVSFANGLAISYSKLGNVYTAKGDLNKALDYYEKYYELNQKLYALEPNNVSFANGLAISYSKLGQVYTAKGNLNKALDYYEKYYELNQKLYTLEPNNVDFANGLAISYYKLYEVNLGMEKKAEAKKYLVQAVAIFEALKNAYPDYAQFTQFWNYSKMELAELD